MVQINVFLLVTYVLLKMNAWEYLVSTDCLKLGFSFSLVAVLPEKECTEYCIWCLKCSTFFHLEYTCYQFIAFQY